MEGCSLLACPQVHVQLPFLYGSGPSATYRQLDRWLDPPLPSSNQEDALTDTPTSQSDGGTSSTEVPSSQVCQVNNQYQRSHPASSFAFLPSCLPLLTPDPQPFCPPPPGHSCSLETPCSNPQPSLCSVVRQPTARLGLRHPKSESHISSSVWLCLVVFDLTSSHQSVNKY